MLRARLVNTMSSAATARGETVRAGLTEPARGRDIAMAAGTSIERQLSPAAQGSSPPGGSGR